MINFAYAQSATQQPSMFASFIPLILIFSNFLFFINQTSAKKQKEHRLLLDSIKRGDEILTSGGIVGKVTKADAERLNVDIASNVNVVVYRSTVADVLNKKN